METGLENVSATSGYEYEEMALFLQMQQIFHGHCQDISSKPGYSPVVTVSKPVIAMVCNLVQELDQAQQEYEKRHGTSASKVDLDGSKLKSSQAELVCEENLTPHLAGMRQKSRWGDMHVLLKIRDSFGKEWYKRTDIDVGKLARRMYGPEPLGNECLRALENDNEKVDTHEWRNMLRQKREEKLKLEMQQRAALNEQLAEAERLANKELHAQTIKTRNHAAKVIQSVWTDYKEKRRKKAHKQQIAKQGHPPKPSPPPPPRALVETPQLQSLSAFVKPPPNNPPAKNQRKPQSPDIEYDVYGTAKPAVRDPTWNRGKEGDGFGHDGMLGEAGNANLAKHVRDDDSSWRLAAHTAGPDDSSLILKDTTGRAWALREGGGNEWGINNANDGLKEEWQYQADPGGADREPGIHDGSSVWRPAGAAKGDNDDLGFLGGGANDDTNQGAAGRHGWKILNANDGMGDVGVSVLGASDKDRDESIDDSKKKGWDAYSKAKDRKPHVVHDSEWGRGRMAPPGMKLDEYGRWVPIGGPGSDFNKFSYLGPDVAELGDDSSVHGPGPANLHVDPFNVNPYYKPAPDKAHNQAMWAKGGHGPDEVYTIYGWVKVGSTAAKAAGVGQPREPAAAAQPVPATPSNVLPGHRLGVAGQTGSWINASVPTTPATGSRPPAAISGGLGFVAAGIGTAKVSKEEVQQSNQGGSDNQGPRGLGRRITDFLKGLTRTKHTQHTAVHATPALQATPLQRGSGSVSGRHQRASASNPEDTTLVVSNTTDMDSSASRPRIAMDQDDTPVNLDHTVMGRGNALAAHNNQVAPTVGAQHSSSEVPALSPKHRTRRASSLGLRAVPISLPELPPYKYEPSFNSASPDGFSAASNATTRASPRPPSSPFIGEYSPFPNNLSPSLSSPLPLAPIGRTSTEILPPSQYSPSLMSPRRFSKVRASDSCTVLNAPATDALPVVTNWLLESDPLPSALPAVNGALRNPWEVGSSMGLRPQVGTGELAIDSNVIVSASNPLQMPLAPMPPAPRGGLRHPHDIKRRSSLTLLPSGLPTSRISPPNPTPVWGPRIRRASVHNLPSSTSGPLLKPVAAPGSRYKAGADAGAGCAGALDSSSLLLTSSHDIADLGTSGHGAVPGLQALGSSSN